MKYRIIVDIEERDDGRHHIDISYPIGQDRLPVSANAHILTGAIGLLIRGVEKEPGINIEGHELLTEIVNHLEMEFVNSDAYKDVNINKDIYRDED